jgi:hypothetical protein
VFFETHDAALTIRRSCLMTNHAHLPAVSGRPDEPARGGEGETFERLRLATRTGRPRGADALIDEIGRRMGSIVGACPRDRKPRPSHEDVKQLKPL